MCTNIVFRRWAFGVLIAGIMTTTVAGILPELRLGFWSLPHWLAYTAYVFMGIAVAIARTDSECRGLFRGAVLMASLSTLLALDVSFFLLELPLTLAQGANHDLILRYVIPLVTLTIGLPSFLIVFGRRVFGHEDRAV